MISVREYANFDDYEVSCAAGSGGRQEELAIVHKPHAVCCDLTTRCRKWQTAVKRFFDALGDDARFDGWRQCIVECVENGCFQQKEINPLTNKYEGGWYWGIEDLDGSWYIYLNVQTAMLE